MRIKRTFLPGSNWLYYKFYCGESYANVLLSEVIKPFIDEQKKGDIVLSWFFVRYGDPDFHVRLRLKLNDGNSQFSIMEELEPILTPLLEDSLIWDIQLGTYQRELERYGEPNIVICEELFYQESEFVMELLRLEQNLSEHLFLCMVVIMEYLNLFFNNDIQILAFLTSSYRAYKNEFNVTKEQARALSEKYNVVKSKLEYIGTENFNIKCLHSIQNHITKSSPMILAFKNKTKIAADIIHMFANRLFYSDQRAMELVAYHHLEKYYRTKLAKQNIS